MSEFIIRVEGGFVTAELNNGQWSAPTHRGGRVVATRGAKGLRYVLGGAKVDSGKRMFPEDVERAISVE